MEYWKNDVVTIQIDDIGNDGEGIGKIDGYALFVKDAVIGDLVEAKITKVKKNYGYARVERVITPSSFRVEPECAYHRQCGGCQIQAMDYERQLLFKEQKIRNNLIRIGGFEAALLDEVMEPIVGMENPWRYRNKAQFPVGYDKNENLITGFYAGRTHDIIPNTDCLLGAAENKQILEAVLSYMKENDVTAYREQSGKGLVRHILIRTGFASGEIMVCLVINGRKLPLEEELVKKLTEVSLTGAGAASLNEAESHQKDAGKKAESENAVEKRIVSISVSVNMERTNVIMGKEIRVLWGRGYIEDSIRVLGTAEENRIKFHISPLSFYQVNPLQTEKLYSLALAYAGLTGRETVWDLYCGIGTISLFLAKYAKKVYGVEIIPQAIEDARENARINGIDNAEFYVGKAEEVLPEKYEKEAVRADVIVVDPPRKGCDDRCLETMLAMKPGRIVYVSCDSATLARDLRVLVDGGYEVKKVRGVDQFGGTVHVETVCQLVRKSADDDEQKDSVEKDGLETDKAKDGVRKRIDYREEEIPDCGCIYG
ncbi:MAG: 23S rRNA (uracil(1939)-C(5))-methyltransferase RlmD [Lachnospiraceae bacterium]|nr:23S rRNA (uracil(1939)-C(5))-methyltransferase RlmD [Lachnospiraceae bacterium]